MNTGELRFTTRVPTDRWLRTDYRTLFWTHFTHDGVILRNSLEVLEQALHRHTAARPDYNKVYSLQTELQVRENQVDFVVDNFNLIIEHLHRSLGPIMYSKDMRTEAYALKYLPHPKRKLRENAIEDLLKNGEWQLPTWTNKVEWKLKLKEFAKARKIGRIIVDIGVSGSLLGAPWTKCMKEYLASGPVKFGRTEYLFCADPSPGSVITFMGNVYEPRIDVDLVVVCFSDDAIVGFRDFATNEWIVCNADISACDASQGPAVFALLFSAFEIPDEVRDALISQILAPINIHNPAHQKEKVVLEPNEPYLQSGSTLTTLINCVAWLIIAHRWDTIHQKSCVNMRNATIDCGYYIDELQPCRRFEDLQFLKQSPMLNTKGEYVSVLNLGVILRASGMCKGDLPGRGDIVTRARNFQHSLMNGLLNGIDYAPIRMLQPDGETMDINLSDYASVLYDYRPTSNTNSFYREDFYRRYELTADEIDELETYIRIGGYGQRVTCSAVQKILLKDYGYGEIFEPQPFLIGTELFE